MYVVVMYIVPFSLLAALNTRIYLQVRKANQERAKLSSHQQREIGMATMLICVVIVFFACNLLAFVVNVLEVRQRFTSKNLHTYHLALHILVCTASRWKFLRK